MAKAVFLRDDLTGEIIPEGREAQLTLTEGGTTWVADVDRENPLLATVREKGLQRRKRGRPRQT